MADKKKVKFVRIKGKVVPIRSDKGGRPSRTRSGDTRTRRKRKPAEKKSFSTKFAQSIGFQVGTAGALLGSLGFGAHIGSQKLLKTGVRGAMTAFDLADSKKFERMVRFAQKSGKISKKFEIIGLGLQAAGAVAGGIEALIRR